jgi:hypothetical protein
VTISTDKLLSAALAREEKLSEWLAKKEKQIKQWSAANHELITADKQLIESRI